MNESNMPWNNLNKKDKNKIWTVTKWCLIIIGVMVVAVGLGYFGTKFWSKSDQSDSTIVSNSASAPTTASNTTSAAPAATVPTPVVTGTTTTPTVSSTSSTPATTTTPAVTSTTTPVTSTTTVSTVVPQINEALTLDNNGNGKIDDIELIFSESMNTSITSTGGFKVSGYTIKSLSWTNNKGTYPTLDLYLKEGDAYDTDATPVVAYTSSSGKMTNTTGTNLSSTTVKAVDQAAPEAISAVAIDKNSQSGIQTGDEVIITFSEPVKTNPNIIASNINKILPLGSDHNWRDISGNIGSVNVSLDNKTITVILSTTSGAPTVAVGDAIHIGAGLDSIQDLSANKANSFSNDVQITGSF